MSVPSDQSAEVRWRPPEWLIPWISRLNTWVYRRSGGRYGAKSAGMYQLLLTVRGRRSGGIQTVTLPFWYDTDGTLIVVASFSGAARNPAWYHNVADRDANPTVQLQLRSNTVAARADVLEGDERAEVWDRLTADRPFYARYQQRTDRTIPLVRLTPLD